MYVVMRKFSTDHQWNICGVFADKASVEAEMSAQEKSGREAVYYSASHVWIAENGNHTWTT